MGVGLNGHARAKEQTNQQLAFHTASIPPTGIPECYWFDPIPYDAPTPRGERCRSTREVVRAVNYSGLVA